MEIILKNIYIFFCILLFSLPIRDGNPRTSNTKIKGIGLFSLPIRDGNFDVIAQRKGEHWLFSLPIRDGNANSAGFHKYVYFAL